LVGGAYIPWRAAGAAYNFVAKMNAQGSLGGIDQDSCGIYYRFVTQCPAGRAPCTQLNTVGNG
jgi:hypothetical protein